LLLRAFSSFWSSSLLMFGIAMSRIRRSTAGSTSDVRKASAEGAPALGFRYNDNQRGYLG
jgi:hypothetical protein